MADPARKTDRHYTYADYVIWPDDERWELIDGVVVPELTVDLDELFGSDT